MKTDSEKLNDIFKVIEEEFLKQKVVMPGSGSVNSSPVSQMYMRSLEILGS